ncbi:hypothetical protein JTB14_018499 [Gonioctena quinquepunctata]|nr:hypothetical protein JTB14_018499 [Gonioctena quinquepunctata]
MEDDIELTTTQLYKLLLGANKQQTIDIKTEIQNNISSVRTRIADTNRDVEDLKEMDKMEERKLRKNNVLVFGLKSDSESLLQYTLETLNKSLDTNICEQDIIDIFYLGRESTSPIVIGFVRFFKKVTLFENPQKLFQLKSKGIAIANDQCAEDREEHKILIKHLKIAESQKLNAMLKGFKLIIDNQEYTASELKVLETADRDLGVTDSEEEQEEDKEPAETGSKKANKTADRNPTSPVESRPQRKRRKYSPKLSEIRVTRSSNK